jgi:hypothetical protein
MDAISIIALVVALFVTPTPLIAVLAALVVIVGRVGVAGSG